MAIDRERGYIEPGGLLLSLIFGTLVSVLITLVVKPPTTTEHSPEKETKEAQDAKS